MAVKAFQIENLKRVERALNEALNNERYSTIYQNTPFLVLKEENLLHVKRIGSIFSGKNVQVCTESEKKFSRRKSA